MADGVRLHLWLSRAARRRRPDLWSTLARELVAASHDRICSVRAPRRSGRVRSVRTAATVVDASGDRAFERRSRSPTMESQQLR